MRSCFPQPWLQDWDQGRSLGYFRDTGKRSTKRLGAVAGLLSLPVREIKQVRQNRQDGLAMSLVGCDLRDVWYVEKERDEEGVDGDERSRPGLG